MKFPAYPATPTPISQVPLDSSDIFFSENPPDPSLYHELEYEMPSVAVLPTLTKTLTDLMDEDLYQAPPLGVPGLPSLEPLSSLLNIPDSFMDQYSRMNGSNLAVMSGVPTLYNDNGFQLTPMHTGDNTLRQPHPNAFNSNGVYAEPQQGLQFPAVSSNTPDTTLIRTMSRSARLRNRIQTLDPHLLTLPNKQKDDDFLFNSDILPSNLLSNQNFFSDLDNSFFVPKTEDVSIMNLAPVPGYEGDYLQLEDIEEDAEYLSEDSEDGDYFQDDDDYMDDDYKFPRLLNNIDNNVQNNDYLRSFNSNNIPDINDLKFNETQLNFERALNLDERPEEKLNFGYSQDLDDMETEEPEPESVRKDSDDEYISSQSEEAVSPVTPKSEPHHPQYDLTKPSVCHLCLKQFSRPYDLVRHENTIHATKKKIFRCVICEGRRHGGSGNGTLKTFSRGDALTRHIKMKHGLEGAEAAELINDAKEHVEYVRN